MRMSQLVGYQLSRHYQRRAIGIAPLLFLVMSMASCGLFRGAIFAASISVVCKCLFRCLDSGVR